MSIITDLIDKAVLLEPGEKISWTCNSHKELKSMKVSLYRERKKYEERLGANAVYVEIKQEKIGDDVYELYIYPSNFESKFKELGIKLHSKTGEVIQLEQEKVYTTSGKELSTPCESGVETESQRVRRLMLEDGLTEEEINEILKED